MKSLRIKARKMADLELRLGEASLMLEGYKRKEEEFIVVNQDLQNKVEDLETASEY